MSERTNERAGGLRGRGLLCIGTALGLLLTAVGSGAAQSSREHWESEWAAARQRLSASPKDPDAHLRAGVAALELGRIRDAERHLETAWRRAAARSEVRFQLGRLRLVQADDFLARDKPKIARGLLVDALALFEQELDGQPGHPGALGGRATALLRLGRRAEAIEAHRAWIEVETDAPAARVSLVRLLADEGRTDEALGWIDGLGQAHRAAVWPALFPLARTLYAAGRDADAQPLFDELATRAPDDWRVTALRPLSLLVRHEPFQAAQALLQLLDSECPEDELSSVVQVYHRRYVELARSTRSRDGPAWELPQVLLRQQARYPADARIRGFGGRVLLLAVIGTDGVPTSVRAIADAVPRYPRIYAPPFREAAREAVAAWRYAPATLNGRPVEFPVTVEIEFTVD